MPFNSSMRPRSTSPSGEPARAFITLIRVCPPASARAPSSERSNSIASPSDPGRAYPTSRRSISVHLIKCQRGGMQMATARKLLNLVERRTRFTREPGSFQEGPVAGQGGEHCVDVFDRVVGVRRDPEVAVAVRGDAPVFLQLSDQSRRVD